MQKLFIMIASLSGAVAVGLGAFGAHALKNKLSSNGYLETYQTAVQYHFIHTLALLFIGLIIKQYPSNLLNYSGWAMIIGIILFSGSLYTLSITGIKWLGAITPIGGLAFIIGWVLIFVSFSKS